MKNNWMIIFSETNQNKHVLVAQLVEKWISCGFECHVRRFCFEFDNLPINLWAVIHSSLKINRPNTVFKTKTNSIYCRPGVGDSEGDRSSIQHGVPTVLDDKRHLSRSRGRGWVWSRAWVAETRRNRLGSADWQFASSWSKHEFYTNFMFSVVKGVCVYTWI